MPGVGGTIDADFRLHDGRIMRGPADYSPLLVGDVQLDLEWATEAQARVHHLLIGCAAVFAETCNSTPNPKFSCDQIRRPALRYGRGLGTDEATTFLRALDAGLVTLEPDGAFFVPSARACSTNLHLVGRNEDHVAVHTEVLVHVGAYVELVLDHGWSPECIAFDPFIRGAALDLWGFAETPQSDRSWWEGSITFVAEAKARVGGSDSLTALAAAFERLERDGSATANPGHLRKWDELRSVVHQHGPVDLLLAADGARWWYAVEPAEPGHDLRLVRKV